MKTIRRMTMAEATKTMTRRHGKQTYVCSMCQYWKPNYCGITARFQVPNALACVYGRIKIGSELARKRKSRKGETK